MRFFFTLILTLLFPLASLSLNKIYFWHSMAGQLGTELDNIVAKFNATQSDYAIVPVFKGNYSETLTATVAAFRAHQQPGIVQIFEVGTATMINPAGVIVPLYQLMQMAKIPFDTQQFIPAVADYYSDSKGQLLAMPFNSSSAVMYYNKQAFQKAGINPDQPPKTWTELAEDAKKIVNSGYSCGFTTAWPSWIQIETFSAWHNTPIATENNGFSPNGINARMIFNNKIVLQQITALKDWQKTSIFRYGGREDNAETLFISGNCAMMMESSGSLRGLTDVVQFPLGVAMLPYWENIPGAPQNTIIGGAALWAMKGFKSDVYHVIAHFFAFLAQPEIQALWSSASGYIPTTNAAYQLLKKQGFYAKLPGAEIAIQELNYRPPKPYTKGLRLGNYSQIREINEEAIEAALSGAKSPQKALNDAVTKGNQLLKDFQEDIQD